MYMSSCLAWRRCLTGAALLFSAAVAGKALPTPAAVPLPLSQVEVTATLSIAGIQQLLRAAAADSGIRPHKISKRKKAGVGVDLSAAPRLKELTVEADRNGTLTLAVPIDVTVTPVRPGKTVHAVDVSGCRPTTFTISLPLVPNIAKDGRLTFRLGRVTTDNRGYKCRMTTNAVGDLGSAVETRGVLGVIGDVVTWKGIPKAADVDVAQLIRAGIVEIGTALAAARIDQINGLLPGEAQLRRLIEQPAVFGDAVTLGIDRPALRVLSVAAEGDAYRLMAALQGRPRLLFVDEWTADASAAGDVTAADGFRLPATLLFPTDTDLLPDPMSNAASGWLGAFRLRPVPAKTDLAVLQRRDPDGVKNVVWLSGGQHDWADDRRRVFDQPMSNVLQRVVCWLSDPELWRDVDGVSELKGEVLAFKRLLERFEEETRIPLGARGSLHFHDLRVDLRSLLVTDEAILADVILHGRARLDMHVSL